jgi:alpha-L-fucosidase 2
MFVSYPDQAFVIRLSTDQPGGLGFKASLDCQLRHRVVAEGNDGLVLHGRAPYFNDTWSKETLYDDRRGMTFSSRLKVLTTGGDVSADGSSLRVKGADSAVLIFSAATSYNGPNNDPATQGIDPVPVAKAHVERAAAKSYEELLSSHLEDYRRIFRKLWIEINGENPHQRAIDFQYNRFEVIQCSREGGQPMLLQGLWNKEVKPNWYGHWTMNSEAPKAYWTTEAGNMAECFSPVTNFVEELARNGAETARINYGCRGWVAHHNVDIWKHTAMVGRKELHPYWVCWMMGGVLMTQLLWDHYAFSGDVDYLRDERGRGVLPRLAHRRQRGIPHHGPVHIPGKQLHPRGPGILWRGHGRDVRLGPHQAALPGHGQGRAGASYRSRFPENPRIGVQPDRSIQDRKPGTVAGMVPGLGGRRA